MLPTPALWCLHAMQVPTQHPCVTGDERGHAQKLWARILPPPAAAASSGSGGPARMLRDKWRSKKKVHGGAARA